MYENMDIKIIIDIKDIEDIEVKVFFNIDLIDIDTENIIDMD